MKNVTLFVRDIPKGTTADDLLGFIEGGIPPRLRLGSNYKVSQPKILMVTDKVTMETHFHGLVTVEPEALAEPMIGRLNAQRFMGRHVVVRRYYERLPQNERRLEKAETFGSDRRTEDRRRSIGFEKLSFKTAPTPNSRRFLFGGHFQKTGIRIEDLSPPDS